MSNGVNQCAACGGLWGDDEPHVACPSDHPSDPTDKAVALLKTIGLDITYTDEGLRVVAEQIGRLYVTAPRTLTADENYMRGLTDARAAVDAVGRWRSFPDDTLLSRAAVLAAIDALIHDGEDR